MSYVGMVCCRMMKCGCLLGGGCFVLNSWVCLLMSGVVRLCCLICMRLRLLCSLSGI